MKSQEVKDSIALGLMPKMSKEGFLFKKKYNEFTRINGDFIYFFKIEQVLWSDHYSIDIHLEICQKKVELIVEKILGKRRHKFTIGADIGRIHLSTDGRKIVNGSLEFILLFEADIEAAIETIFKYYKNIALPYFTKYSSLAAIDDIINNKPFDYCPAHVGGMFYERCFKGLIVAKLVNNPNYRELVKIYDMEIKETYNEEFIDSYIKVRDYLEVNKIV